MFKVTMLDFLTKQAWGTQQGRNAFEKLNNMLADRREFIVEIDMRGIEKIDASCSREVLANLVERYRGSKWFFLSHVGSASIRENIDAAFARKDMSVILRNAHGEYEVLGRELGQHLIETLEVVEREGNATSRKVCVAIKGLAITACNNRLKDLSDAGLLARFEGAAESGGKEFSYVALR